MKMHVTTNLAFNVNYKIAINALNYDDSFIKCFDESHI